VDLGGDGRFTAVPVLDGGDRDTLREQAAEEVSAQGVALV
jgi:hypothetical protein